MRERGQGTNKDLHRVRYAYRAHPRISFWPLFFSGSLGAETCIVTPEKGTEMFVRYLAATALMLIVSAQSVLYARDDASKTKPKAADAKDADIDTEHIFGFIEGSDIGDAGEKEGEAVSSARLGKGSGFYAANSTALFYKYSPVDHFRIAPVISFV